MNLGFPLKEPTGDCFQGFDFSIPDQHAFGTPRISLGSPRLAAKSTTSGSKILLGARVPRVSASLKGALTNGRHLTNARKSRYPVGNLLLRSKGVYAEA